MKSALEYLKKQNLVDEHNRFDECDYTWDSVAGHMDDFAGVFNADLLKERDELKETVENLKLQYESALADIKYLEEQYKNKAH